MIIPVSIIIIYTSTRYEYRPLRPGESAVVKINLSKENMLSGRNIEIALSVPLGLKIETPPLRLNGSSEIYWRVMAESEGVYDILFHGSDIEVKKKVFVAHKTARLASETYKGGIVNSFFNPGEPPLAEDAALDSIRVSYPSAKIRLFGYSVHWLILFFIFTLIFGFILMKPLNVRI